MIFQAAVQYPKWAHAGIAPEGVTLPDFVQVEIDDTALTRIVRHEYRKVAYALSPDARLAAIVGGDVLEGIARVSGPIDWGKVVRHGIEVDSIPVTLCGWVKGVVVYPVQPPK